MKKTIAIIEVGSSREYAFESIRKAGYHIVLFTRLPERFEGMAHELIHVETNNEHELLNEVINYNEKNSIDAALTLLEGYVPITAKIAKELNLKGVTEEVALNCRNKYIMRKCFEKHDLPIPKFILCNEKKQLDNAVKEVGGFPCIIKPIDGTGSTNVTKVTNMDELNNEFNKIKNTTFNSRKQKLEKSVLIEELLIGNEYCIDSITINGETTILGICDYEMTEGPHFVEMGYLTPSLLSENSKKEVEKLVKDAIKSVGIVNGVSHCELKSTKDGFKLIEIAGRHGGGHIAESLELSRGINHYVEYVKFLCGDEINIKPKKKDYVIMDFIFPKTSGIVKSLPNIEEIRLMPEVNEISLNLNIGDMVTDEIQDYTSVVGYFLTNGKTSEEVKNNAKKIKNKIVIET